MRESVINAGKVPEKYKYNFAFPLVFIRSSVSEDVMQLSFCKDVLGLGGEVWGVRQMGHKNLAHFSSFLHSHIFPKSPETAYLSFGSDVRTKSK